MYILLFQKWHKIPVWATWVHRPHKFLAVGAITPMESAPMWVHYIMSCSANYEPTRSAMQTSICQKRPIFRIPYFRPSKCRPLESAAGGKCPPPRPPSRRHWRVGTWSFPVLRQMSSVNQTASEPTSPALHDSLLLQTLSTVHTIYLYSMQCCRLQLNQWNQFLVTWVRVKSTTLTISCSI